MALAKVREPRANSNAVRVDDGSVIKNVPSRVPCVMPVLSPSSSWPN